MRYRKSWLTYLGGALIISAPALLYFTSETHTSPPLSPEPSVTIQHSDTVFYFRLPLILLAAGFGVVGADVWRARVKG
jgi:hypothetical protein